MFGKFSVSHLGRRLELQQRGARCHLQRPALRECPDFKTCHLNGDSRKLSWEIARPGWTTTVYTAGIRCAPGSSLLEFEATTEARNRKTHRT